MVVQAAQCKQNVPIAMLDRRCRMALKPAPLWFGKPLGWCGPDIGCFHHTWSFFLWPAHRCSSSLQISGSMQLIHSYWCPLWSLWLQCCAAVHECVGSIPAVASAFWWARMRKCLGTMHCVPVKKTQVVKIEPEPSTNSCLITHRAVSEPKGRLKRST